MTYGVVFGLLRKIDKEGILIPVPFIKSKTYRKSNNRNRNSIMDISVNYNEIELTYNHEVVLLEEGADPTPSPMIAGHR